MTDPAPQPAAHFIGITLADIRAQARKHKLIHASGAVHCWSCWDREALLPSLHCLPCLTEARLRTGTPRPYLEQRAMTEHDRAAMLGRADEEQSK